MLKIKLIKIIANKHTLNKIKKKQKYKSQNKQIDRTSNVLRANREEDEHCGCCLGVVVRVVG